MTTSPLSADAIVGRSERAKFAVAKDEGVCAKISSSIEGAHARQREPQRIL